MSIETRARMSDCESILVSGLILVLGVSGYACDCQVAVEAGICDPCKEFMAEQCSCHYGWHVLSSTSTSTTWWTYPICAADGACLYCTGWDFSDFQCEWGHESGWHECWTSAEKCGLLYGSATCDPSGVYGTVTCQSVPPAPYCEAPDPGCDHWTSVGLAPCVCTSGHPTEECDISRMFPDELIGDCYIPD